MKCCGYAAIGDRPIPKTCSISLGVEIGCRESIISIVQNKYQWITIGIITLLSIQVKKKKEDIMYDLYSTLILYNISSFQC
jgi:hypothetical protein